MLYNKCLAVRNPHSSNLNRGGRFKAGPGRRCRRVPAAMEPVQYPAVTITAYDHSWVSAECSLGRKDRDGARDALFNCAGVLGADGEARERLQSEVLLSQCYERVGEAAQLDTAEFFAEGELDQIEGAPPHSGHTRCYSQGWLACATRTAHPGTQLCRCSLLQP